MIQKYCDGCPHLTQSDNVWLVGHRREWLHREYWNCTLEWTDAMKEHLGNLTCDENEPFFFQTITYPEDPALGLICTSLQSTISIVPDPKFEPPESCPYLLEHIIDPDQGNILPPLAGESPA